ncbi:MAG: hypothetical protein ACLT98_08190 [Eggerthellaceae bacterium]
MGTVPEEAADDPADPVDPCALIAERRPVAARDRRASAAAGGPPSRASGALFISAGTVSTHPPHLQKTGVDNWQSSSTWPTRRPRRTRRSEAMETAYLHELRRWRVRQLPAAARATSTQSTLSKHVALLEREFRGRPVRARPQRREPDRGRRRAVRPGAADGEALRATSCGARGAQRAGFSGRGGCRRDGGRSGGRGCRRRLACGRVAGLHASAGSRPSAAGSTGASWARSSCTWRSAASRRSGRAGADARGWPACWAACTASWAWATSRRRSISSIPFPE